MEKNYSINEIAHMLFGGSVFVKLYKEINTLSAQMEQLSKDMFYTGGIDSEQRRKFEKLKSDYRIQENLLLVKLCQVKAETQDGCADLVKQMYEKPDGELLALTVLQEQVKIFQIIYEGFILNSTSCYLELVRLSAYRIQLTALRCCTPIFDAMDAIIVNAGSPDAYEKLRAAMAERAKRATELEFPKKTDCASVPSPKKIVTGFKAMAIALGMKPNETAERKLRYAAKESGAPIVLGRKGVPPKADLSELVGWFNNSLNSIDDDAAQIDDMTSGKHIQSKDSKGKNLKAGERVFDGEIAMGHVKASLRATGHLNKKGR